MGKPYKVAVIGPGAIGSGVIRGILKNPAFQLVGVKAYNPAKAGKDVGELAGVDPVGLKATLELDDILKLDTDCVLYISQTYVGTNQIEEQISLLAAGHNVIGIGQYQALDLVDPPLHKRFVEAALKGGSTYHTTGVDPEFFSERLVLLFSALQHSISHIELWEISPSDTIGDESLKACGFGQSMEEANANHFSMGLGSILLVPTMRRLAARMGYPIDRVEVKPEHVAAPFDIDIGRAKAPKGTLAGISRRYDCYSGDHLFYTHRDYYYLSPLGPPPIVQNPDCYVLRIEGEPSIEMTLSFSKSLRTGELYDEKNRLKPAFVATAALVLNAVPAVVAAPPGIYEYPEPPSWVGASRV